MFREDMTHLLGVVSSCRNRKNFKTTFFRVMYKICNQRIYTGNTKGGSITVLLTSCLTGLESAV